MTEFAKRNLTIFFRDKSAVFFSLLSSIIIIALYAFFLGDVMTAGLSDIPKAKELMDNWVMAGLLAATSATASMGAFGIYVSDRAMGIYKDFYSSPISRRGLVCSYVLSSFTIGVILSFFTAILAIMYIVLRGGSMPALSVIIGVMIYIILTTMLNTAMMFFIVSFFKSTNAFSSASTVLGTLVGFLTGIYLPIGSLPAGIQWLIKLFPTSHGAALLRQVMTAPLLDSVPSQITAEIKTELGISYLFGSYECGTVQSVLIIILYTILFIVLAILHLTPQ